MKRGEVLLVVSLMFIFLISGSLVGAVCEENDRIMNISAATNAHGALWDKGYDYDICCSNIFGVGSKECSTATPHPATCSNPVLWLYSETNSHASTQEVSDYDIPVCYGDLSCHKADETKNEACEADEKVVVRLYQETNSHISNADVTYKIKICCKAVSVEGAYWANMKDVEIDKANLSDLVKLVVRGEGFEGKQIEYTIYKGVSWWFDNKVASSSTTGFTTWEAGKKADGSFEKGKYYFKAKVVEAGGIEVTSKELEVLDRENTPPIVRIISPEDKQIYFKGENLKFKAEVSDVDDSFTYEWDIENGTTKVKDSLDFNYAYASTGQKNIVLKVTDDRGAISIARVSILIVDYEANGKYAFAYIDLPAFLKGYESPVGFKGESSYAVEVSANQEIKCIGGNCPSKTKGCYPINTNPCSQLDVANAPASQPQAVYGALLFLWEFSKDNWQTKLTPYQKVGAEGVSFNRRFTQTGKHYTKLNASLSAGDCEPGLVDSEFFVGKKDVAGECSEDGSEWIFGDGRDALSTLVDGVCGMYDEKCCPYGYSCQAPMPKTCLTIPDFCETDDIDTCADYTNQIDVDKGEAKCEADDCDVGGKDGPEWEASQEDTSKCGEEGVTCGCKWDSVDSKCYFSKKVITSPDPTQDEISYECVTETEKTEEEDYYTLKLATSKVKKSDGTEVTENIENDYPDCPNKTTTIRKTIKLMFFTLVSLVVAVAIIIAIYFIKLKKGKIIR